MVRRTNVASIKAKTVKPYAQNAKKHPDDQLRKIAASLREFGWRQPIVVDKNNEIIVGHGRWFAYKKHPEGIAEPWITSAADLTPDQVKAYRIADNDDVATRTAAVQHRPARSNA